MALQSYNPSLWTKGAMMALVEGKAMAEPSLVDAIASVEDSTSNKNDYPWIGEAHAMQLLKDELNVVGLSDALYSLTNKTYAIGLEVPRDSLHDDQLGAILQRVRDMSVVALNFANKLLVNALINGTSVACYDGVSFFNDSHPIRGLQTAVQDNLLAGSGVTSSNLRTDLVTGIAALNAWKAESGEPLHDGRTRFQVVCPVQIALTFQEAINAMIYSNTTNVLFKGLDIGVRGTARLTDANDWYLCDVSMKRPLIYQQARRVESEFLGPGSDHWVKRESALFKVSWRGEGGYNHPGLAVKFVNS